MEPYVLPTFLLQTLVWIPTRIIFKLFYKLEIKGLENIKHLNKGVVFASNHTSELDPILLPAALPFLSKLKPIFYTCREKSFYKDKKFGWRRYFYGGKFFNIWGAYEVVVGINNYELALKNHIKLVRDGHSVYIFPEGGKNRGKQEIQAKGGVAYLSFITNAPIIPVRIDGAVGKEKITLSFGKPLYPKDIFSSPQPIISNNRDDYKTAAAKVMQRIQEI